MALRHKPSAIGLRQVFPVQTKSTCLESDMAAESARPGPFRQTAMGRRVSADRPDVLPFVLALVAMA